MHIPPVGDTPIPLAPEVEDFIAELGADDVGREVLGGVVVRFEGFSDICQEDASRRLGLPADDPRHLPTYEAVYDEVSRQWALEEGREPIASGFGGSEDYPVQWAVFPEPDPENPLPG